MCTSGNMVSQKLIWWSLIGVRNPSQSLVRVQSDRCGSVRNRTGHSCCCYVSFNRQEHFEPLWLRLSNKSKYSQLLIDYLFQEHEEWRCFHWGMIVFRNTLPGWLHMSTAGRAIAYIFNLIQIAHEVHNFPKTFQPRNFITGQFPKYKMCHYSLVNEHFGFQFSNCL